MKRIYILSTTLLFPLALLLSIMAFAAIAAHYHGSLDGKPVTANLETQAEVISGTLAIGEAHYLLQAEKSANGFQGTLLNMSTGQGGSLHILEQENRLKLEIKIEGEPSQQLELQPDGP